MDNKKSPIWDARLCRCVPFCFKFASRIFLIYTGLKPLVALFFVINQDNKKLDWKPAFRIFTQVSTWVVVPVVLALIVGKALDKQYGTDPWIFLGLTALAFFFSSYGIVRVISKYMKTIDPPSHKATEDEKK